MGQDNAPGEKPMDPNGVAGINQGAQGMAQGAQGSVNGQMFGAENGMNRAAQGGMQDNPAQRLGAIVKAIVASLQNGQGGAMPGGAPHAPTPAPAAPPPMGGAPPV